ncbi:aminotransferase class I/II-fold pyridoxal phosphate-dependent enzyme [Actinomadura rugatobispora]|uniref:8-amino-7-oxononanoate synthase n=1 Tax=Actinomadura rugatobispora TaxID=1994 RepID=A0ABW1A5B1_9ACTN|nr:pyridoxal phosphate-dependent aminotransferase family protein [Actinomadura rugatobispora]
MVDAFDKCHSWREYDIVTGMGLNPYYHRIDERAGPNEVRIGGRPMLMAGSNDYLALSTDPRTTAAAAEALGRFGTGTSGSRLTNGTLALHEELEAELAAFLGHEAALVTPTGFQANLALCPLLGPRDALLADRYIHASLIDAARLGQARLRRFRHNDMGHLGRLLEAADPGAGLIILTEGMFSTTGDLCDLPGISKLAAQHGARVVLDGAHDIGVLGPGGRGAAEHYGQGSAVDLHTLTFSKCFGTVGGAVTGPEPVIRYLRHHSRAAIFSASLPAPSAAAALAALDIIRTEPGRRRRVLATAERVGSELAALGFAAGRDGTPTIPVHVGETFACLRLWRELFEEGVFTNAMIPPGVPEGHALIRVAVTASHTGAQVERILDAFAAAGRRLNLIG